MHVHEQCSIIMGKHYLFCRTEYPNVCLILAGLILCISNSNSAVRRCFNILTQVLSDTTTHSTLNMLMLIKCNDKIWTEQEWNELIKRANEIYMSIRRVKMLGDNLSEKIQKLYEETEKGADAVNISDEDSESDH